MTSITHYAFSYLVTTAAGVPYNIALVTSTVSLLPDIDHPESILGRIFPTVSRLIMQKYGHRTITHSIFAIMTVAILLTPILFFSYLSPFPKGGAGGGSLPAIYFALLLSYSSHIFIDLFNRAGVKLLAPVTQKEYISFRTPALRILVNSWQEYVLLFMIVFLAFSISGERFSISEAARSVAKLIYRNYDGALTDYENSSSNWCTAKVEYFDHITALKKTETFLVLTMYPERMIAMRMPQSLHLPEKQSNEKVIEGKVPFTREGRLIVKKDVINEIEIQQTTQKIIRSKITGHSLKELEKIPSGSLVSGTIHIKNYLPELQNTEYLRLDHTPTTSTITLTCALPEELRDVVQIEHQRTREIESLKTKVSSYQIARLKVEEASIKRRLIALQRKGFYENYLEINRLNSEIKKIQSRIDTLNMREASGTDVETQIKIESLEKDFAVEFEVYVVGR